MVTTPLPPIPVTVVVADAGEVNATFWFVIVPDVGFRNVCVMLFRRSWALAVRADKASTEAAARTDLILVFITDLLYLSDVEERRRQHVAILFMTI